MMKIVASRRGRSILKITALKLASKPYWRGDFPPKLKMSVYLRQRDVIHRLPASKVSVFGRVEWVSRKLSPSKESISALTLSSYRFCFLSSLLRATFFHCWICGFTRYFCHHSYHFILLILRSEWVNSPHIQSGFQPRSLRFLRQFNPTISSFFSITVALNNRFPYDFNAIWRINSSCAFYRWFCLGISIVSVIRQCRALDT